MSDRKMIYLDDAINAFDCSIGGVPVDSVKYVSKYSDKMMSRISALPSAEPEIIRCKDCKFYIPVNRKTKTGICDLTMHQNFGYDWFCAGAEKRADMRGEQDG